MGPNERRLVAVRMGNLAIPPGGGLADGLAFLGSREKLTAGAKEATAWVTEAIAAVKSAPDNAFGDDEEICAEILRRIEERRLTRKAGS